MASVQAFVEGMNRLIQEKNGISAKTAPHKPASNPEITLKK